jgi:hypothetical protein
VIASLAFASGAFGVSMDGISPVLRKRTACMVSALKSAPGIDQVTSGVSDNRGALGGEKWLHPYVQYRFTYKDGHWATVRFDAHYSGPDIIFETILSGLASPEKEPPDYGTDLAGTIWETKCHEHVAVLFM